jgi:chaperonin GroES
MSKLKPTSGHVVLRPIEEEELMAGNIIIPDMGREKPEMAEVIAVTPIFNFNTDTIVPLDVKVGDKVLIPKMGAQTVTLEGEEYYITQLSQIIAILEE